MITPISIPGVTTTQIAALLAEIKADPGAAVATPSPNNFSITGHNIVAAASYSPSTAILLVQVVKKPWYVSSGMIHDQIVKALG